MIKSALSVLPTRPVLYIVPVVVTLVMAFYYWDRHADCTHDRHFRSLLGKQLDVTGEATLFHLDSVTDFVWDKVRIINNFKPQRKIMDCPFGWDWTSAERRSLIEADLLSALVFAHQDVIVEYVDIRSDQIAFEDIDTTLSPEAAVFRVHRNTGSKNTVNLTLETHRK